MSAVLVHSTHDPLIKSFFMQGSWARSGSRSQSFSLVPMVNKLGIESFLKCRARARAIFRQIYLAYINIKFSFK